MICVRGIGKISWTPSFNSKNPSLFYWHPVSTNCRFKKTKCNVIRVEIAVIMSKPSLAFILHRVSFLANVLEKSLPMATDVNSEERCDQHHLAWTQCCEW